MLKNPNSNRWPKSLEIKLLSETHRKQAILDHRVHIHIVKRKKDEKRQKNCHKRQTIFFRIVFFHVISALLVYVFFLGYVEMVKHRNNLQFFFVMCVFETISGSTQNKKNNLYSCGHISINKYHFKCYVHTYAMRFVLLSSVQMLFWSSFPSISLYFILFYFVFFRLVLQFYFLFPLVSLFL